MIGNFSLFRKLYRNVEYRTIFGWLSTNSRVLAMELLQLCAKPLIYPLLTYWGWHKMASISQITFSNSFELWPSSSKNTSVRPSICPPITPFWQCHAGESKRPIAERTPNSWVWNVQSRNKTWNRHDRITFLRPQKSGNGMNSSTRDPIVPVCL